MEPVIIFGLRTWDEVKEKLKSVTEDELISIYTDLILARNYEVFEKLYKFSMLTQKILTIIGQLSDKSYDRRFKDFVRRNKIGYYSLLNTLLGRFATTFGALRVLPDKEPVFQSLLIEKLRTTKYNPYLIAIPQRTPEVVKWLLKYVPCDDLCLELSRDLPDMHRLFVKEEELKVTLSAKTLENILGYTPFYLALDVVASLDKQPPNLVQLLVNLARSDEEYEEIENALKIKIDW